jgi:hypothetical protein
MWNDMHADVIRKTLAGFREQLAEFAPRFVAMLVILVVGVLVAAAVRFVLKLALPRLGFDRFAERTGTSDVLRRGGIASTPSRVLARTASWLVLGMFVLLAVGALDLQYARNLVERTFTYLPQVLIAAALLLLGTMAAAFLRRSVLIAAVNAGIPSARLLAGAVHAILIALFMTMAMEHLGIGRQVIVVSFTILFGGVVLALALAFGLAGRDLARDLLERLVKEGRPESKDDLQHL